jgi:hypothetical protein
MSVSVSVVINTTDTPHYGRNVFINRKDMYIYIYVYIYININFNFAMSLSRCLTSMVKLIYVMKCGTKKNVVENVKENI